MFIISQACSWCRPVMSGLAIWPISARCSWISDTSEYHNIRDWVPDHCFSLSILRHTRAPHRL